MNKTQAVLEYLKKNKSMTSLDAINLCCATRLSDIIYRLRKKGYNIITKDEEMIDQFGSSCDYARYIYLGKEQKPNYWLEEHPFFKGPWFKKGK